MKLPDLRHVGVRAWPSAWTNAHGVKMSDGDAAILTEVRLLQSGSILLGMTHEGRECYGLLIWDRPPAAAAVAETLVAAIGRTIRELNDLEI